MRRTRFLAACACAMALGGCSVTLDESLLEKETDSGATSPQATDGDAHDAAVATGDAAATDDDAAVNAEDAAPADDASQGVDASIDASSDAGSVTANPAPVLTSVTPGTLVALANDTTVTLAGSGFVESSVARIAGVALETTYASATQLTAVVPKATLALPGSLAFTVTTPAPGGGTSGVIHVGVGCDATGVDIGLTATGQSIKKPTSGAIQLNAYRDNQTCPAAMYSSITELSKAWVVQNQTGAAALLSAWAVCDSQNNDAFLSFYRRSTVPQTTNELSQCASVISEGKNGRGGYASPESGPSSWCPGLTKGNGEALSIAACERVVVFAQEYDVGLGPANFKVQLDTP